MAAPLRFVSGLIAGAGLMYIFDPDRGARRRSALRAKLVKGSREVEDFGESRARHRANQAKGVAHEAWSRLRADEVDDTVLEQRVRSQLGHVVSHPRSVDVTVREGLVTLSGLIFTDEVERAFEAVRSVQGVKAVENQMNTYQEAGSHSGRQH